MEPSGTVVEPSAEPSVFPMFSYTFSTPPVFTLCTYYIIINSRGNRNRRTSGGPGPSRILIGGLGASIGRVLCGHLRAFARHGCQTSTESPESAHLLPLQETQKAPPPNLSQLELKEACSFGSVPGLFYASNLWKQLLATPFQSGSSTRYFPPV